MQKADTRPWDPGERLWKQVEELDRLITLFKLKLENCYSDSATIFNNITDAYLCGDLEKEKKLILDRNSLTNKAQKIGNKLCTLLWQFQIKLEEIKYSDFCKDTIHPIQIKIRHDSIIYARMILKCFDISFIPLKFPSQEMI